MTHTNFLAVLVAAIVAFAVGGLWYGPLFGKPWSQMMGITKERMEAAKQKGMTTSYVVNFIAALVMSYVLSNSIAARPLLDANGALWLAFWIWLGFIAAVMAGSMVWESKPMKLFWINSLYYLVALWIMALILVSWK